MNFFESQAKAKRRTGLLVLLFSMAVVLIVAATWGVIMAAMGGINTKVEGDLPTFDPLVGLGGLL